MSRGVRPLDEWVRLVRRRWGTGVGLFAVVVALGAALLLLTRPIYRSEAMLRLGQPPPPGGVSPSGGLLSFFQMGGDPFANDLELLGSRSVAETVVERMAMTATLDAPAGWSRDSLLTRLGTTRETEKATWVVAWATDGRVTVRRTAPTDSLVGTVAPGQPMSFGGLTVAFRPWREGMPRSVGLSTVPFAEATRKVRSALSVERPRREANVVALAYDHTDPTVANGVMTAAVQEFVRLRTAIQDRESGETSDSLRVVARQTAEELRRAEDALERLQRDERIVAPDAQSEALVERQAELVSRRQRARAELAGVDEMLRRLDTVQDPGSSWTALLSYPAFLENQTLGNLLSRLTELHEEREALATRRTGGSRDLRLLDEQIGYLDRSLRQVAREYREGVAQQIAGLGPEIAALDRTLAGLPARAVELTRRQRDVRLLGDVLVVTEQRLRQEELREALTYANVQVIDPPALRDRPVWPRKKMGLAVVLLLAGGTGLLGMVVRDRTDRRVRQGAEVREILGAPVLAVVRPNGAAGRSDSGRGEAAVDGGAPLSAAEAAVLRGSSPAGRLVLVTPGDAGGLNGAGELLRAARGNGDAGASAPPEVRTVRDYATAAEVAARGEPIAVVVELGRTGVDDLRRLRVRVDEANGTIAGAVLVCRSRSEEVAAWE